MPVEMDIGLDIFTSRPTDFIHPEYCEQTYDVSMHQDFAFYQKEPSRRVDREIDVYSLRESSEIV